MSFRLDVDKSSQPCDICGLTDDNRLFVLVGVDSTVGRHRLGVFCVFCAMKTAFEFSRVELVTRK